MAARVDTERLRSFAAGVARLRALEMEVEQSIQRELEDRRLKAEDEKRAREKKAKRKRLRKQRQLAQG